MKAMRMSELIIILKAKNKNMLITKEYIEDLFDDFGDDYYRERAWGSSWELAKKNKNKNILINYLTRTTD